MFSNIFQKTDNYSDRILDIVKKPVYIFLIGTIYTIYFLVFIGVINYNESLINGLDYLLHIFICLFLMIRFHPFRKHELKQFDSDIIFGSALALLFNFGFAKSIRAYFLDKAKIPNNKPLVNIPDLSKNNGGSQQDAQKQQ